MIFQEKKKVNSVMIFQDESSSNFRLNVWEILQIKFVEISPDELNSNFSRWNMWGFLQMKYMGISLDEMSGNFSRWIDCRFFQMKVCEDLCGNFSR